MNKKGLIYRLSVIDQHVDIISLLEEMNIKHNVSEKSGGREVAMCCPFHKEKTPSFNYNLDTHLYKCWGASCKKKGHGFTKIYAAIKGISFVDAMGELLTDCPKDMLDSETNVFIYNTKKHVAKVVKKQETVIRLPQSYELIDYTNQNCYWDYLNKRGITKEVIDLYSIGYCDTGFYCGRIIIPIDFKNDTVGFIARRIGDDEIFFKKISEYEKIKGENVSASKKVIYPRDFNVQNFLFGHDLVDVNQPLIIVEGIFDLFAVNIAGYSNAVANNGTNVSDINALRYRKFPELWVIPDKDDKSDGYALYDELLQSGANRNVKIIELPEGHDPGSVEDLERYIAVKTIAKRRQANILLGIGKKI